ncbi:hypothetical protein HGRIS_001688 [Hohenbuehelia grisea]|uniref:Uncharacterized protein n=1 Tax=Hohenbuehelia grisea TaxID=104357 RepID=A0ABR3JIT2_9AGAR
MTPGNRQNDLSTAHDVEDNQSSSRRGVSRCRRAEDIIKLQALYTVQPHRRINKWEVNIPAIVDAAVPGVDLTVFQTISHLHLRGEHISAQDAAVAHDLVRTSLSHAVELTLDHCNFETLSSLMSFVCSFRNLERVSLFCEWNITDTPPSSLERPSKVHALVLRCLTPPVLSWWIGSGSKQGGLHELHIHCIQEGEQTR